MRSKKPLTLTVSRIGEDHSDGFPDVDHPADILRAAEILRRAYVDIVAIRPAVSCGRPLNKLLIRMDREYRRLFKRLAEALHATGNTLSVKGGDAHPKP